MFAGAESADGNGGNRGTKAKTTQDDDTYSLCICFTRVPWFFVLYKTGAKQGIRLRAKPVSEENKENTGLDPAAVPKHAFLARKNAEGMHFISNVQSGNRMLTDGLRFFPAAVRAKLSSGRGCMRNNETGSRIKLKEQN
jgi:hypothetical protein